MVSELSIKYKKILVGVDFSSYSEQALQHAEQLAKVFDADLLVLHVIESFTYTVTDSLSVVDHDPALTVTAQALIDNLEKTLSERGFRAKGLLAHGAAYKEIITTAQKEGIDLIVLGTHGRNAMEHLLLGSVSERVVRLAPCPVLTVPKT